MNAKIYNESLKTLIEIIKSVLNEKGITVFLFGSRATGKAKENSDIDIGIISTSKDISKLISYLRERIENSNIPYKVDILDLSLTSEEFRQKVLKEAKVIWKS
jgi:hypothetical protein